MEIKDLESLLFRFLSFPLKGQIKIDFDQKKRVVILSVSIFLAGKSMPLSIQNYVDARKDRAFLPHQTFFRLKTEREVGLVQEIPFHWGFQPDLRHQILQFRHLAERCHRMFAEIAAEEKIAG